MQNFVSNLVDVIGGKFTRMRIAENVWSEVRMNLLHLFGCILGGASMIQVMYVWNKSKKKLFCIQNSWIIFLKTYRWAVENWHRSDFVRDLNIRCDFACCCFALLTWKFSGLVCFDRVFKIKLDARTFSTDNVSVVDNFIASYSALSDNMRHQSV